jgi:hypothetical protein
MKIFYVVKIALVLAVALSGLTCSNEEDPFVLRDTDILTFGYEESSQTFTVRTNGAWSVSNDGSDWITLDPASGTGDGVVYEKVYVNVDRNGGRERTGKIAINAAGKEIYIDVIQATGSMLFGTPSLSDALIANELIEDIYIRLPYQRATGNESFTVSVQVSGEAAGGINNVSDYPVSTGSEEGTIMIPLSGTPVAPGVVTFTISTTYPDASAGALNATVGAARLYYDGTILITGFLSDPRGTDAPATGAGATFPNPTMGGASTHAGPYEYVQFMALEDIDFSVTPYSVVICKVLTTAAGAPTADGWAAGGTKTHKFNLTGGTVSRGEFFYVGGTAKALNGYNTCGIVDISSSKWIRTIAYNNPGATFDGFGNQTGGLMNNYNTANRSVDGIAVFEGTEVDKNSVPMDAIFFGNKIDNSFDAVNLYGYLIPYNDFYNPVNAETSESQPMFGQGSNIKFINGPVNVDGSDYTMLGGELNANKQWIRPREATFKLMTPCQGITYSIADIESGPAVTQYNY